LLVHANWFCTLTLSPQEVIAAGSAVAASDETIFDPIGPHVERLRTWWTQLLGPALAQGAQLIGAMALSVFGGSFDDDSAAAVLKEVPGEPAAARLLKALQVLSVLQDAGAWTGEAGLGCRQVHVTTPGIPQQKPCLAMRRHC
jgi:hypothetical protein